MRNFYTAALERHTVISGTFETEPFETAWASEAMFFLRIEEFHKAGKVNARVRVSADGIHWIDEGTAFATMTDCGDYFVRVKHFGGWLQLACEIEGEAETTIHLALKE